MAGAELLGDIGDFLSPVTGDLGQQGSDVKLARDPFETTASGGAAGVASAAPVPTVNASRRPARQLTAILIADDIPVAVIDGEVVSVGDVLPDGARIASIREDRVSLLERGGQWRVLTLSSGRQ